MSKKENWTRENISDVNYDPDKKLITFKTYKLAEHCYYQVINSLDLFKLKNLGKKY